MARVLDHVRHLGCRIELNWMTTLRLVEWQNDLPDAVAEFCDEGDTRWFTSSTVAAARSNAVDAWNTGSIEGGKFGEDPVPIHPVQWQHRVGKIAQQPQWHHWCEVELGLALSAIGAEFARILREDFRWVEYCTGGELLFAAAPWRANFLQLAQDIKDPLTPAIPELSVHSPLYDTWQ